MRHEFESRCAKNKKYSLRSYAKYLSTDPSYLSKVFANKAPPSKVLIKKFLSTRNAAVSEKTKSPTEHNALPTKEVVDTLGFQSVRWQHLAILALMNVKGFNPEPRWVSRRLGIEIKTAKECISDLLADGIIKVDSNGAWILSADAISLNLPPTSPEYTSHQIGISERVKQYTLHGEASRKSQSSMTFSMNAESVPAAKLLIKNFRRSLMVVLSEYRRPHTDVYALQVSLSPISETDD